MGNLESIPPNYGFRVVEIENNSPGSRSGLILDTDFILAANGKMLRKMNPDAMKVLVQVVIIMLV